MLNRLFCKLNPKPFELVVLESFKHISKVALKNYFKNSKTVYIIEPFVAYHIKNVKFQGFADELPDYAKEFLQMGLLKLLPAESIDGKSIHRHATDKSVDVVEAVFSEYRKEHKELFGFVSDSLKSPEAENAFKKNLCDRLAEFYSTNILLHRISKFFGHKPVLMYTEINAQSYLYMKSLLLRSKQEVFEHPNVQFSSEVYIKSFFENLKQNLMSLFRLSAQTVASGFLGSFNSSGGDKKRSYSYGMAIVSPTRQLKDSQQRPDFIIDRKKIHAEDVVYFPLVDLISEQKKQLEAILGAVYYPPRAGRYFSDFTKWLKLFRLALKKNFLGNADEINTVCNVFFHYFSWQKVLNDIKLKHFITYCDFGVGHIGRNLALNQAGAQTWYFTDSMNMGCNLKVEEDECNMRHPFWTYLYYDHFVTWDELLARYFKEHPGTFKQVHVVGCLWGGHINKQNKTGNKTVISASKNLKGSFKLAAFDTTYSRNGFTSYAEGIAFAENLLQLADALPDIHIILKEKKDRNLHSVFDPVLGPELLNLYNRINAHPRMTTCSDQTDSSELISISDMVISFPFTSTTFEALSVNKPAIWHDPLDCYKGTPYAKVGGVMTHSYEELKAKVMEIKNIQTGFYQNPIPMSSPLMDPYRDGKAIDRFRELLCSV